MPPELTINGGEYIRGPRLFQQGTLQRVEEIAREEGFKDLHWEIEDRQGTHQSSDLASLLSRVLWRTVTTIGFAAYMNPSFHNTLHVFDYWDSLLVRWSCEPENRVPMERAGAKIIDLLEALEVIDSSLDRGERIRLRFSKFEAPTPPATLDPTPARAPTADPPSSTLTPEPVALAPSASNGGSGTSILNPATFPGALMVTVIGGLVIAAIVAVVAFLI